MVVPMEEVAGMPVGNPYCVLRLTSSVEVGVYSAEEVRVNSLLPGKEANAMRVRVR